MATTPDAFSGCAAHHNMPGYAFSLCHAFSYLGLHHFIRFYFTARALTAASRLFYFAAALSSFLSFSFAGSRFAHPFSYKQTTTLFTVWMRMRSCGSKRSAGLPFLPFCSALATGYKPFFHSVLLWTLDGFLAFWTFALDSLHTGSRINFLPFARLRFSAACWLRFTAFCGT